MTPGDAFMRRALALARRGKHTHPNPKVGAVVVRDGVIVGEGYHLRPGTPHAETNALAQAGDLARGATIYVTLEPCSHTANRDGSPRTPCADRCIDAGIAQVVAAMEDPDVRVSGRGFDRLRGAGVGVTVGVLESDARALNRPFIKHRETGLPYILHKAAMTLDGKIATVSGSSRWITGEPSREYVHQALRGTVDAVVVGVGTVLADDPSLTTRLRQTRNAHQPVRVVIDSHLRTPPEAKVAAPGTLVYATESPEARARHGELIVTGAEVVLVPSDDAGRVDIALALRDLAERGHLNVLLEAGGELAASFYAARLVDTLLVFVAPKLVGGRGASTPIGGDGLAKEMNDALRTGTITVKRFGADIALRADILYND